MQIDLYTHFFKVSKVHPSANYAMRKAFQDLLQVQYVKIRGKFQKQNKNIFAAKSAPGEYRFHINYLDNFKLILRDMMINDSEIDYIQHYPSEGTEISVAVDSQFTARDYQEEVIQYILDDGYSKLVTLPTGAGKVQKLTAKVKVPNGWKTLGDLNVGDILNMPNGDSASVSKIFEIEEMDFYRLTFEDGRTTECGKDHLWEVFSENWGNEYGTLDTETLYQLLLNDNGNNAIYIPLVDPIHSADNIIQLPLDPYLLGAYFGNRYYISKEGNGVFDPKHSTDGVLSDILHDVTHPAVVKRVNEILNTGKENPSVNLIPEVYLNASLDQRLALLRGLMDIGGRFNPHLPFIEFNTTSMALAEQVKSLLYSVGCKARCQVKTTEYKNKVYYQVLVHAQIPSLLFKLTDKREKCVDVNPDTQYGLRLKITNIEKIEKSSGRCIFVDHPDHLYITDDYICTHNTFTACKAGELYGKRTLVMVLGRYKEKWRDDILGLYGKNCKLQLIKGLSEFLRLINMAKDNQPLPDVIVVTTTTMQLYIKEWEKNQDREIPDMIPPEEIYKVLGIGYRIIDEAHQHFHMVFKNDLYSHLEKAVYLTATLESNDRFILSMYHTIWPLTMRTQMLKAGAYDRTLSLLYRHAHPDKVRCVSNQGYSHVMYEQSIWKHVPSRIEYLDMIGDIVEKYYLPQYKAGRRMLIFCSLVDTCKEVAQYLNHRFSDQKWKISKFTAEDAKEVIDTNDITVSTLGKAGTALDIDGLVVCLNTVALAEPKANIQAKGRLRNITNKPGFEDVDLLYIYTVGRDIPRHVQYHHEKKALYRSRTKEHLEVELNTVIGSPLREHLNYGGREYWQTLKLEGVKIHA